MNDAKIESTVLGGMLTEASFSCAQVVQTYGAPSVAKWKAISVGNVEDSIQEMIDAVRDGDLSGLEAMLVSQAIATQTMFVTLASRAQSQKSRENLNAFTVLALKAQAQSRATIQALTEIKFPRSTIFAKQANVTTGNQQINNGIDPRSPAPAREEIAAPQNKLLESSNGNYLDAGTTRAAGCSNPELEPVEVVNRAKNPRRKIHRGA